MTAETQQGQSGGNAVAPKGVSFGHDAIGDITSVERYTNLTQAPSPATDAADTTLGYSSLGQLTSIVHSHNGTTIEGLTYGYDTLSRVSGQLKAASGGEFKSSHFTGSAVRGWFSSTRLMLMETAHGECSGNGDCSSDSKLICRKMVPAPDRP
ncbi:MAG TPA: hypothetical protein VFI31_12175 [Pirellulales bacterium]|nr:hypothetical protein [Pirellulales bacterium]